MKNKECKKNRFFKALACTLISSLVITMASPVAGNFSLNTSVTTVQAATKTTSGGDTFSWDNANVYFLLTDRFNNGNTSNDHSYNRGIDQNGNVINYKDKSATFHGGDFAGITDKIKEGYFNDLGVNALWISAPYEQIHGYVVGGDGSESFAHYSYHGYYVLDYTQTDANFGTEEEFKELVDTAHEHGIRVVLDIVMNHSGYNTIYDMNEFGFGTLLNGWQNSYFASSGINNTSYHSYIDYTSSSSDWSKWWGSDWIRCGVAGYTEGGSTNQTQCLSGLPDFKTESNNTVGIPKYLQNKWNKEGRYEEEYSALTSYLRKNNLSMTVTNVLTYWLQSWVREYGIDGFRCDTAKHVEYASWKKLKDACVDALRDWKAKNPDKALDDSDFWMTGEVWDHGVYKDEYYTQGGFDSIINFSTQGGGILAQGTVAKTYQSFADTINNDPDFNVLSYISSHDSVLTRGNSIYMGSALLLLPGAVQTFYGDETDRPVDSTAQTNGDHEVRGDMNWSSMNKDTLAHWQKVGTFRNNHISVGAGANASLNSNNGVAFSRVYSKGDIYDKIAACIGSSSNTDVTIDISSLWEDGQILVNAYDFTTSVVTNGSVTFNSGKNATILIEEPDGKPLVNVTGNAKFHGTQEVTINITDADFAKVSVDGGKKFIAQDGDTFTIGETAYEGDTISVSVEATNDKGTRNATYTFYKAYENESLDPGDPEAHNGILYVKSYDGTAPYVYAWKGASTTLAGAWPGTKLTNKNEAGYYVIDLGTTDKYNVIINNGGAKQTSDITNLEGGVWIDLTSANYTYDITAREVEPQTNPINLYVSSYTGAAPYLYIWDANGNYNGSFPGKALTEKTNDGLYKFTIDSSSSSVNCIVSYGSNTTQSSTITGINGDTWITIKSADCKSLDVTKSEVTESYYGSLKKATREIKNLTASNYTNVSYSALYSYVASADALIALGEENAPQADMINMINAIKAAKAKLVVAEPVVSGLTKGSTTISGTAAYGSNVNITVGSKVYKTVADDVTGEFLVSVAALALNDTVSITCTLGANTGTYSYTVNSSENVSATSITLDNTSASVAPGGKTTLTASILPSNTTNKNITWTTSNSSVATVSGGVVTGVAAGTATITATTSNGLTATAVITVAKIEATNITLNESSLSMNEGSTSTLKATLTPSNATNSITWTTSNSAVATVSASGVVTGVAEGTATITATTSNGLKVTVAITVNSVKPTSIILSQTTATVDVGNTTTLTATILPNNATNKTITWTTNNPSVATVSNGVITGITTGTATITATTSNGLTATVGITVAESTSSMYYSKPSNWGTTIYAYIWNDAITYKNAAWPGVAATLQSDGTYAIKWPENYTGSDLNVIFNDGSRQTADLKAVKNGYYTSSGFSHIVSNVDATAITLDKTTASVEAGSTVTLTKTLTPSDATSTVTWSTSNSSVATVSTSGVVTGVAAGTVTITATTSNGLTATATITVTAATKTYMYFTKPSSWGSTIYAYMWTSDGKYKNAAWPGVVTEYSNGHYRIEYPTGYTGLKIIFNDGSKQTADLDAVSGKYYSVN